MKPILLFFVAILTSNLFAQDSTFQQIDLTGKYALQFQIAENFRLTSFNGTVISGKYNFTSSLALRLGVSISSEKIEVNQTRYDSINSSSTSGENDISGYSINIKSQLLFSNPIIDDISFYYGGGFLLSYYFNKQNDEGKPDSILASYNSTNSGFGYGFEAVAGVEWFVKSNISLSGEYGINFIHTNTESEQKTKSKVQNSSYKISLSETRTYGSYVRLGLSVYF